MSDPGSAQVIRPTPPLFDDARVAVAGFLARYSGGTRVAYARSTDVARVVLTPRVGSPQRDVLPCNAAAGVA